MNHRIQHILNGLLPLSTVRSAPCESPAAPPAAPAVAKGAPVADDVPADRWRSRLALTVTPLLSAALVPWTIAGSICVALLLGGAGALASEISSIAVSRPSQEAEATDELLIRAPGFAIGQGTSRAPSAEHGKADARRELRSNGSADDVPVVTAAGDQRAQAMVPDGAGGAIVAWEDARSGGSDVYAQHLRSDGSVDPSWPVNGRLLASGSYADFVIAAAIDGAGGAIVIWEDSTTMIHAQRVRNTGAVAWGATGVIVATTVDGLKTPNAISDRSGGAYVVWRNASTEIYAMHLTSTGVDASWPANGLAVCTASGLKSTPVLCSDGGTGAIAVWPDRRTPANDYDLYAQHIRINGTVDPAWPVNGTAVTTAASRQVLYSTGNIVFVDSESSDHQGEAVVPDGAGGCFVTWTSGSTTATQDVYVHRVLASGVVDPAWPVGGVVVCNATGPQGLSYLVPDGSGGATVVWADGRNGFLADWSQEIYAQHVLNSGAVTGPANGIPVLTGGTGSFPHEITDGDGGVSVFWTDRRDSSSTGYDVYAQHVVTTPSFAVDPDWPARGLAVSTAASDQASPTAVWDGADGAIVTWADRRNFATSGYDIYADLLTKGVNCDLFGAGVVTPAVEYAERLVPGDVNEDGILDLVEQNFSATVVLLGQGSSGVGNGTFAAGQFWSAGGNWDAELLDLNDDGILDFLGLRGTALEVRLGQGSAGVGNGSFGTATSYSTTSATGMATGDFNEDGITDVAVVDEEGANPDQVEVYLGQGSGGVGNGTFGAPTPIYSAGGGTAFVDLAAGDFNEDGITDLVLGQGQQMRVLLGGGSAGHGNGTFVQGQLLTIAPSYPPDELVTGDFNEDGITDLAGSRAGTVGSYRLMVMLGQGSAGVGNGTFALPVVYGAGTDSRALRAGDFNADGIADIVVTQFADGKVALMTGQGSGGVGNGTFAAPSPYTVRGNQAFGLAIGDFVEDGMADVAATAYDSVRVTVLPGQTCGSPLPVGILVQTPNGGEQWAIGSEHLISWTKGAGVIAVDVEVSRDGGMNWEKVGTNVTGTSFAWTVTGPTTGQARARVIDVSVAGRADASDANFGIGQSPLAVGPSVARPVLLSMPPYPNPFTDRVAMEVELADDANVLADVCDLGGRRIASLMNHRLPAGHHRLTWDLAALGSRLTPTGLYFIRVRSSGLEQVHRLIRIR